jgi:hypothetical protein
MTSYEDYLKRIEGTFSTDSFMKLADALDEDDSLTIKERDTLKRYAMYKHRCVFKISKEYKIKELDYVIEYGEDYEGRFLARVIIQKFTEDDQLFRSQKATIMIKPGVEIRAYQDHVGILENDELKVLIYPIGLTENRGKKQ